MSKKASFRRDFRDFILSPWLRVRRKHEGSVVVNKIDVRPIHRKTQDIGSWRRALQVAESPTQDRRALYDLYADCLLDGTLKRSVKRRIQAVSNRRMRFTAGGQDVPEITALLSTSFFEDLLRYIMHANFYGHSLIELGWPARGSELSGWTAEVDRRYVKPRYGLVVPDSGQLDGIDYRSEPFTHTVIEVGEHEDLGDLLEACQYVIYKRGNMGDWAEFAEVFGMPFRWAKYQNEQTRQVLEEGLRTAGSAGFVVAPEDAGIETVHANVSGGHDVFRFLRQACNEEILICILGGTMTTTEARSSGYAQAKVQASEEDELHVADREFVLRVLNEKIVPYLERIGYPARGGSFDFVESETLSDAQRIDVVTKLSQLIPIPESYLYDRFRVPRPSAEDPPIQRRESSNPAKEEEKPAPGKQ
jgi:hypothetical protein